MHHTVLLIVCAMLLLRLVNSVSGGGMGDVKWSHVRYSLVIGGRWEVLAYEVVERVGEVKVMEKDLCLQ
jgi:hypothetical protein